MGQYYKAIILAEKSENSPNSPKSEFIRTWLDPLSYNNGSKLTEHAYIGNNFVAAVEAQISPDGMFYRSRLVWAGDYADPEPLGDNLNQAVPGARLATYTSAVATDTAVAAPTVYRFIVNHTKRQYVDKEKSTVLHPLPLLTAEGNGRGGGDYHGPRQEDVGIWARDVLSAERIVPEAGYTEFVCGFAEPPCSNDYY
jgi:hypothetical protein